MTGPRVAVVMTVHNRKDTTLECLRTLRAQRGHGALLESFVADDGSTDGTAAAIAAEFPEVVTLPGDGSLFWNGGMRLAFAAALERDYDYYMWMNDDTHLDPHAVRSLLETHEALRRRGHEAAIVVGSTRHPETGELTYGGVVRPSRLRPLKFRLIEPSTKPEPCETMNGNCVLIPRAVARRVGNLDPAYRQKMGDFDYGLRSRALGCSVWVAPGTVGTCATHAPRDPSGRPLGAELKKLYSIKELPVRPWGTFTRRWGGPWWIAYWMSPYLKRGSRLVAERLAARSRSLRLGP